MRSRRAARIRAGEPSRAVSRTPTFVWARASTSNPRISQTRVFVVPMSTQRRGAADEKAGGESGMGTLGQPNCGDVLFRPLTQSAQVWLSSHILAEQLGPDAHRPC